MALLPCKNNCFTGVAFFPLSCTGSSYGSTIMLLYHIHSRPLEKYKEGWPFGYLVSSLQTVNLVFLYFTFHFYFSFCSIFLFFYFLFLEQLGLGLIGHAVTSVTT